MIQFVLETDRALFEDAMRFAQQQMRKLVETHPGFYPMYTAEGKWKHEGQVWTNWCDGFFPGMMWIFHKWNMASGSADKFWLEQAVRYTTPLAPRQHDRDVHDLGFIFMSTYYRWYRLTQDPKLKDALIQAGKTEALRFKENGQYLRSFVGENSLFIDIMMNVGIIFYAARETGDRRLRDIALRHCLTTRRILVRGDGSTAQEGIFDLQTGEFLRQSTQQGYRGDSCWSRGLAWALYGFSLSYEYSRDPRFLETAEACADYYITALQQRRRSALGFQCAARVAPFAGYLGRGHRRFRIAAPVPPAAGSGERASLLVARDSHSANAVRASPGEEGQEVGGHSQGRRLPSAEGVGRG